MRLPSLASLCLLAFALGGCGAEMSWKRGAREQDWAADRADCARRTDFIDCMAARGWSVKNLGDGRAGSGAAAVFFDPDAAMAGSTGVAGTEAPSAAASPAGPAAGGRPVTITPSPEGIPQAMPSPQTLAHIEGGRSSGNGTSAKASAKATTPPAPRNPLDRVEVNSRWKLGGRAGEVDAATRDCPARLGPDHAPEGPHHTLGMLSCLKERGWRALTVTRSE